jgi:hypothetical protein
MTKRLQHPKGPSKMRKAFIIEEVVPTPEGEAKLVKKLMKGFSGFPGWAYHPTRGFKKVQGFKPESLIKVAQPIL